MTSAVKSKAISTIAQALHQIEHPGSNHAVCSICLAKIELLWPAIHSYAFGWIDSACRKHVANTDDIGTVRRKAVQQMHSALIDTWRQDHA